jgi:WD40 repeat protein
MGIDALSRDRVLVVSATGGGRVFALHTGGATKQSVIFADGERLSEALLLGDQRNLLTADARGVIRLWTLDDPSLSLDGASNFVEQPPRSLEGFVTPNGKWRIVKNEYSEELVLEGPSNDPDYYKTTIPIERDGVAVLSPNSRFFVQAHGRTLTLLDMMTGESEQAHHDENIEGAIFGPGSDVLISRSSDNTVRVWSIENELPSLAVLFHEEDVRNAWVSIDGHYVATLDAGGTVRVWTTDNYKGVYQVSAGAPETIQFDAVQMRVVQRATGEQWSVLPNKVSVADAVTDFEDRAGL